MKQVTVYGAYTQRNEYTAAQVLNIICGQGLTETDMDGHKITVAEVASDFPNYMYTVGMITSAYMNGIITRDEAGRAQALWHMLRYGNIHTTKYKMG